MGATAEEFSLTSEKVAANVSHIMLASRPRSESDGGNMCVPLQRKTFGLAVWPDCGSVGMLP